MLEDSKVSRRHAAVRIDGNDVVIEDLGSTNGTWVNGLRITVPVAIHDGDVVHIGTTTLAVKITRAATAPADAVARPDLVQTAPGCTLVVTGGPLAGRQFEVESKLEIGREGTACTLGDDQVSRRHAFVRIDGNDVVIEDLGSTNGTWVNGLRITAPVAIHDGDVVHIGTTTLAVKVTAAPGIARPAPDAPTEPHGLPSRARRSIITVASIVVAILLAIVVALLVLAGR
jgi:pSer/pThr/pTyr-binding forkhead associated (FHA) protein